MTSRLPYSITKVGAAVLVIAAGGCGQLAPVEAADSSVIDATDATSADIADTRGDVADSTVDAVPEVVDIGTEAISDGLVNVESPDGSDASSDVDDGTPDVAPDVVDSGAEAPPMLEAGTISAGPSCSGGLICAGSVSCCDAKALPGGTFMQGRASSGPENDVCSTWAAGGYCDADLEQPEFRSTVSTFALDTFEVTVGRFRKFVAEYPGNKPAVGAGANPNIGSSGWDATWTASLVADQATLIASVKCAATDQTWTDTVGSNETLPINCLDWFTAFAFCAWDGGRLPTEAEWEYAASGGEDRVVPWTTGVTAPDIAHAVYGGLYGGSGSFHGVAPVGSVPLGVGKWGQQDLLGNLWEWTIDWFGAYPTAPSNDYASLNSGSLRVLRGGYFHADASYLRAAYRVNLAPTGRGEYLGLRCARDVR